MLPLLLAACGGAQPPSGAEIVPDENARGELRIAWARDIGDAPELFQPVLGGGAVCAANAQGEAFFINGETGADIFPPFAILDGGELQGGAGCDGRIIAAARKDGVLAAYNAQGEELWRKETGARFNSPPLVDGGNIFTLARGGRIDAYSARLGAPLWRYNSPFNAVLTTPLDSAPVAANGLIYAGINNGVLVALRRANGRTAWIARLAEARGAHSVAAILDVTTPVLGGGAVCAASYQGHAGCVDAGGGILWRTPFSALRRVALDDDGARMFAVSAEDGAVHAFSARNGEALWKSETGGAVSAAFARGALIAGFHGGEIAAFAPDDGRILAAAKADGGIIHLAPLPGDSVLGATDQGVIFRADFIF